MAQQTRWCTWKDLEATNQDVADPSNTKHNNSNQPSRMRSASLVVCEPIRKRRRFRRHIRSTTSFKDFIGGRIYTQTAAYQVTAKLSSDSDVGHICDLMEHETLFIYHPAPWSLRICFHFGISAIVTKAAQGCKYGIQTFRAVPDDSSIFEFCRKGNLDGVRSLLVGKDASVQDLDSEGWTPLHVSPLAGYHPLLLRFAFVTPIAVFYLTSPYFSEPLQELLRLFIRNFRAQFLNNRLI